MVFVADKIDGVGGECWKRESQVGRSEKTSLQVVCCSSTRVRRGLRRCFWLRWRQHLKLNTRPKASLSGIRLMSLFWHFQLDKSVKIINRQDWLKTLNYMLLRSFLGFFKASILILRRHQVPHIKNLLRFNIFSFTSWVCISFMISQASCFVSKRSRWNKC